MICSSNFGGEFFEPWGQIRSKTKKISDPQHWLYTVVKGELETLSRSSRRGGVYLKRPTTSPHGDIM